MCIRDRRDDVRVKRADQVVEGAQRRDLPAGRDVDIHPEGRDRAVGVVLGVGVHGDVALVEVGHHRVGRDRLLRRCV